MSAPSLAVPPVSPVTGRVVLRIKMPQKLRNIELGLLLGALGLSAFALALVQWGALGTLDWTLLTYGAGLAGLTLGLHLVLRVMARDADPFIVPIATMLNGLGLTMIHRLDLAAGSTGWEAAGVRQMAWTAVALVIAIAVLLVVRNYRILLRYRYLAMLSGAILLTMPLWPGIGRTVNGATIWVNIASMTFQPGEVAKIALAIFFAGYLMTARESLRSVGTTFMGVRWPRIRDLGPLLIIWVLAMGVLVFQRDLGTSLLYFGLFLAMLYVATNRILWLVIGGSLFFTGASVAASQLSYVQGRVDGWLDSFNPTVYDAVGGSYQLVQGMFGMAEGGFIGSGLGQGQPNLVPLANSDYIVAALGEELGLFGVFGLLALYLLLVSRGFRVGFTGTDDFGRLLSTGLAFVLALQVFIVIGGITRIIPVTGLTTPFLAAGGSSLVANWIIVALLLRLSDDARANVRAEAGVG
ncbi:MAG: cell division protein [actinobacterium acMicro-4]|nr:MAG: cell division protein [actinobacterium acMicro-4]